MQLVDAQLRCYEHHLLVRRETLPVTIVKLEKLTRKLNLPNLAVVSLCGNMVLRVLVKCGEFSVDARGYQQYLTFPLHLLEST